MKNKHRKDCPWFGVDLDNKDHTDQLDDMPCFCEDNEIEPTPYECRDDPTPGFHRLGPAAQDAARSRAKAFWPFD